MASESKHQNGVDRISELPDAVLCHILSFLPTVYAIWTTILSRRWNNLWTTLPRLGFDNKEFPTYHTMSPIQSLNRFMTAVEGALSLHRSSGIQKFSLSISVKHFNVEDLCRINTLNICAAVKHNVVEMNLSFWAEDNTEYHYFELPQSLFMCKTLENLTVFSSFNICAPPTGSLPSLKVLHVSVLWSDWNAPESYYQNCPALEDLTIAGKIYFHDIDHINISAPTLKRLCISLRCYNEWYDSWYTFYIDAPNMEYLDLMEDAFSNYTFKTTKSLVKAKVHFLDEIQYQDYIEFFDKDPGFATRATALLAGISSVEYLCLDNQPHCLEACYVPALENLTKLKLVLRDCYHWELLTELLKKSPKLKCLVLEHIHANVDNKYPEQSGSPWNPPDFVPICLLSCLKTIKIRGFTGKRDEMEAARYLLKNSDVLNEMAIYTGDLECTKEELFEEFGMFQRVSKACKVVFR